MNMNTLPRRVPRWKAVVGVVAALALSVTACGSEPSESTAAGTAKTFKIGHMIFDTSVPFYSNLIKKERETAQQLGAQVDIRSGNGDLANEISVVQQFVAEKFDLILISPSDPKGIIPAVLQANNANIPVMAVNTQADVNSGGKIVTYVGVDDYTFGKGQGELLVKAIGESGNVGYITGKLGTSAQIQRKAGLMDVLKQHPGIKIVSEQAADWDNAKALAITQDYLSKYPKGQLSAIVSQGPEGVSGAANVQKSGRTDVKFIVGDFPADVRKAISDGTVYGSVNQDPAPQGENAIKYAVEWLKGNQSAVPQPNAYLDLPTITKDNVEQYKAAWGE
ncbi:substrate-binding domain-containing protein [Nonomuraea monospora]|uniref:Substrate-binding domain-containing protein n=2 Tax=Nonomuraea monospora TaxID=568818 RepID=A0ABP5Q1Q6_9ACTN